MNDLVTPFFLVFLQEAIPVQAWQDLENYDVASLSKEQRDIIEADSFWCLSKFLDGIQDNYIFAQLGIQHKVNQLKELIQRIDGEYLDRDQSVLNNHILLFKYGCTAFSTVASTFASARSGLSAVLFSMDEQFINQRDSTSLYYSIVGYLFGGV